MGSSLSLEGGRGTSIRSSSIEQEGQEWDELEVALRLGRIAPVRVKRGVSIPQRACGCLCECTCFFVFSVHFFILLLVFLVATVVSGGGIATQVSVEGGCGKIPFGPSDAAAT